MSSEWVIRNGMLISYTWDCEHATLSEPDGFTDKLRKALQERSDEPVKFSEVPVLGCFEKRQATLVWPERVRR